MANCTECNKEYNTEEVNIPNPIPDLMCAVCGSTLTEQEIQNLEGNPNLGTQENE